MHHVDQSSEHENAKVNTFEEKLGTFGWGSILILTGSMWLVPRGLLPNGTWLMTMGLILLGLNAARYSVRHVWDGFTSALGILSLLAGVGELFHTSLPLLAITLIVIGVLALLIPRRENGLSCSDKPGQRCCEL